MQKKREEVTWKSRLQVSITGEIRDAKPLICSLSRTSSCHSRPTSTALLKAGHQACDSQKEHARITAVAMESTLMPRSQFIAGFAFAPA